jgi:hypothetical protein
MNAEQVRLRRNKQCRIGKLPRGGIASGHCRREVAEREVRLQARKGLTVEFRIRVDEIVQGVPFLQGRQANVAAGGEEDAIVVVAPKK